MLSLLNKEEKAASIKRLKNLSEKQNHENIIGNKYQVTLDGHQLLKSFLSIYGDTNISHQNKSFQNNIINENAQTYFNNLGSSEEELKMKNLHSYLLTLRR